MPLHIGAIQALARRQAEERARLVPEINEALCLNLADWERGRQRDLKERTRKADALVGAINKAKNATMVAAGEPPTVVYLGHEAWRVLDIACTHPRAGPPESERRIFDMKVVVVAEDPYYVGVGF